jgi:hypothetical protein
MKTIYKVTELPFLQKCLKCQARKLSVARPVGLRRDSRWWRASAVKACNIAQ